MCSTCSLGRFLFFSLFSVVIITHCLHLSRADASESVKIGKTSALLGPFVSEAIISASGNNNMPFAFLFGL
jgi:hypothetical protein